MCEIKKLLFSVSEKGNPMAQVWVDDADVNKNSDCIYIALKNQVAYLFFLGVGSKIKLKKSGNYQNVEVPETFTSLFENYKITQDNTLKMIGAMLNKAFDNAFNSIEFIKRGETVKISRAEVNEKFTEFLEDYTNIYNTIVDYFGKSKNKAFKNIGKILSSEESKASEIKDANAIVMQYSNLLAKDVISKNNFIIED